MAKINFKLSSAQLPGAGNVGQLNAPMLSGGSGSGRGIRAPEIQPRMMQPATTTNQAANVPLIDQNVMMNSAAILNNAAVRYQDRKDALYAEDAILRARADARALISGDPSRKDAIGFEMLPGKDAVDACDAYKEKVSGVYDAYAERLDGNARMRYLAGVQDFKMSDLDRVARHTVKQQELFEGQVQYASLQAFKEELYSDPDAAMQNGAFNRLLSLQPDQESQDKIRKDVFTMAADRFILSDPENGAIKAAQFMQKYGAAADAESSLAVAKKIAPALEAAKKERESKAKEAQENAIGSAIVQIPTIMAGALQNVDGKTFFGSGAAIANMIPGKDRNKAISAMKSTAEDSIQLAFNQGMSPKLIAENFAEMRAEATEAGVSIPLDVDLAITQKLKGVQEQEYDNKKRLEDQSDEWIVNNTKVDPNTGKPVYPSELPPGITPSAKLKLTMQEKSVGAKLEEEDKRTKGEYEKYVGGIIGAARSGQLKRGTPEYQQLVQDQLNPAKQLKQGEWNALQNQLDDNDPKVVKEGKKKNLRLETTKDVIVSTARRGAFGTELKVVDGVKKKLYSQDVLPMEDLSRMNREIELLEDHIQRNPNADPMEYWQNRQTQLVTESFWGADRLTNDPVVTEKTSPVVDSIMNSKYADAYKKASPERKRQMEAAAAKQMGVK